SCARLRPLQRHARRGGHGNRHRRGGEHHGKRLRRRAFRLWPELPGTGSGRARRAGALLRVAAGDAAGQACVKHGENVSRETSLLPLGKDGSPAAKTAHQGPAVSSRKCPSGSRSSAALVPSSVSTIPGEISECPASVMHCASVCLSERRTTSRVAAISLLRSALSLPPGGAR